MGAPEPTNSEENVIDQASAAALRRASVASICWVFTTGRLPTPVANSAGFLNHFGRLSQVLSVTVHPDAVAVMSYCHRDTGMLGWLVTSKANRLPSASVTRQFVVHVRQPFLFFPRNTEPGAAAVPFRQRIARVSSVSAAKEVRSVMSA